MIKNPYKENGAYHWDWFTSRSTYIRHVEFLKRWVKEKNTLDIGAGDGLITHKLTLRGVDNDRYAINLAAEKGVKIDIGNASRLPYKNEQFDSALMSDTLDHFRDIGGPLREARRVIKRSLYISLPITKRFMAQEAYHYWRPNELVAAVEKHGFKLEEAPREKRDKLRYYFKFKKIA